MFAGKKTEPFIRYDIGDTGLPADEDDSEQVTLGIHWFLKGNAARVTAEVAQSLNATPTLCAKGK